MFSILGVHSRSPFYEFFIVCRLLGKEPPSDEIPSRGGASSSAYVPRVRPILTSQKKVLEPKKHCKRATHLARGHVDEEVVEVPVAQPDHVANHGHHGGGPSEPESPINSIMNFETPGSYHGCPTRKTRTKITVIYHPFRSAHRSVFLRHSAGDALSAHNSLPRCSFGRMV